MPTFSLSFDVAAERAAERVLFCHPSVAAATEGSAFLRQTQNKADTSGKPSPSE